MDEPFISQKPVKLVERRVFIIWISWFIVLSLLFAGVSIYFYLQEKILDSPERRIIHEVSVFTLPGNHGGSIIVNNLVFDHNVTFFSLCSDFSQFLNMYTFKPRNDTVECKVDLKIDILIPEKFTKDFPIASLSKFQNPCPRESYGIWFEGTSQENHIVSNCVIIDPIVNTSGEIYFVGSRINIVGHEYNALTIFFICFSLAAVIWTMCKETYELILKRINRRKLRSIR